MPDDPEKPKGETVLASIRRLAGEESGRITAPGAEDERLLLTPAQRIDMDDQDDAPLVLKSAARVDVVPSAPASAPPASASPSPALRAADTDPLAAAPVDDEDLRALVAEVLRDELRGPLGDRITRNVRKLVRREVAQAMLLRPND